MSFVPDDLLAGAMAATGLDDPGPPGFRDGLDRYCTALDTEAQLSELGELALRGTVGAALATRLKVVRHLRDHPEVRTSERVVAPMVVVGMFRAGTTFLSYLLDQEPSNRALLRWESGDPVPPPTPGEHRTGPRVDAARAGAAMLDTLNPRFKAIHHEDADGPTECIAVMAQDFKSLSWASIANVPSYLRWLLDADQASAYAYLHDVLRILQSGGVRGRWTLKSPHHALFLDALTAEFPDARVVVLHRDPVVLCASVCSLIASLSGTFSDHDHRALIAGLWPEVLERSIERLDAFRAARPDVEVVDVHYTDLVRDPVGTLAAISEATGRPLSDDGTRRAAAYVAANPKGKHGEHHYDFGTLGLDPAALRERFAGYVERYRIAPEWR